LSPIGLGKSAMDQKDSANNQSIVKTIMMGSRILAQGIYKGEAAKGAIQIKIGQKLYVGQPVS